MSLHGIIKKPKVTLMLIITKSVNYINKNLKITTKNILSSGIKTVVYL